MWPRVRAMAFASPGDRTGLGEAAVEVNVIGCSFRMGGEALGIPAMNVAGRPAEDRVAASASSVHPMRETAAQR